MSRARYWFAAVTAVSAWLLIVAGALVTSAGAGLAVPDWPLSYGTLFPPMVGGILFEHSHRLIAGTVGLMVAALTVWTLIDEKRRWVKRLSVAMLVAVVLQATLGGLTVLFLLPMPVSSAHAALAELFFALAVLMAVVVSPRWRSMKRETVSSPRLHRWTTATAMVLYVQILLGAVVRHSGAGLAIPDFPLSYGRLMPPLSASSLPEVNRVLTTQYWIPYLSSMTPVILHFLHRLGAVVVSAAVIGLFVVTRKQAEGRRIPTALLALWVAQIWLAGLTIWSKKAVLPTTAHVAVGALMFGLSVGCVALTRRRYVVEAEAAEVELTGEGARA